jgi:heptosyltransferase-1
MKILLIKMSSMGDLIHTLPALTDALHAIPAIEIDWVVEPAFADIPTWHPAVKNIIPLALRRWRKNSIQAIASGEIRAFYRALRSKKYDVIIDAQGLLKSSLIAKLARGKIYGYDKNSARESLSSYFYHEKYAVEKSLHAITRIRHLFSHALHYTFPSTQPDFHINTNQLPSLDFQLPEKYFVFLHGTTWASKHYPEPYWRDLIEKADANAIAVYLPWGNNTEKNRAERLAQNKQHAVVLPQLSIAQLATVLQKASTVVSVDTGLGHLSAALTTKTIGLYGPTDSNRVGFIGDHHIHLQAQFPCAPCYSKTCWYAKKNKTPIAPACFTTINPDTVWKYLA